jgi:acetyl-CoA carboxylase, biotin carboxylase subunit
VWAPDRPQAIARALRALAELQVEGIRTTKPLFERLLRDPDVIAGNFDTNFIDGWLARQAQ